MPADVPRQVFRPSPPNYVIGWVVTVILGLLGLAFAIAGPGSGHLVAGLILAVVLLLSAAFVIRAIATSGVIATPANLVYWDQLTRKWTLEWSEIQAFRVGPGRSRGGWPALIIILKDGTRIKTDVAAYRRSYPEQIADELNALRRQYAPPPQTPPTSPGGGRGALSVAVGLGLAGIRIVQSVRRGRRG